MTQSLLRALSVLRWPSAVLVAVLFGLAILSSFQYYRFEARYWKAGVRLDFSSGGIIARLVYDPSLGNVSPAWILERVPMPTLEWQWPGCYFGWWCWEPIYHRVWSSHFASAAFPAWCIIVPLGALSALGFRAKRRLVIPAGACPKCRHPLAGAALCPECGAAAASSGVSAHQP